MFELGYLIIQNLVPTLWTIVLTMKVGTWKRDENIVIFDENDVMFFDSYEEWVRRDYIGVNWICWPATMQESNYWSLFPFLLEFNSKRVGL